jgi:hypothetical protein
MFTNPAIDFADPPDIRSDVLGDHHLTNGFGSVREPGWRWSEVGPPA